MGAGELGKAEKGRIMKLPGMAVDVPLPVWAGLINENEAVALPRLVVIGHRGPCTPVFREGEWIG